MSDALWYAEIARRDYPEEYINNRVSFGKDGPQISAEAAYIFLHNQVPEWAIFIERFEKMPDGSYVFVHRSMTQ